ncbi:MAG TPA: PIG-L family deacetylase [Acidimicrobiaceae bacterium]|nr:PIG-L family deacetylase [Acidimicrobiaceae bacterium]
MTTPLHTSAPLPVPQVALAIGAHPDDIEFWAGATLARWAAAGCKVHFLVCTDGSKGTWDPTADCEALVRTRKAEQLVAAATLGATGEVVFLDEIDGLLTADPRLVSRIAFEIRRLQPHVVLGHDPWKRYRLHPDHRAAGFLTVDAVVAARDPHFYPEHGIAHFRPESLLLFEADEPNHLEPSDTAWWEAKTAALEAHVSQLETTHLYGIERTEHTAIAEALEKFRARELENLRAAAQPFGKQAGEAFHLIANL